MLPRENITVGKKRLRSLEEVNKAISDDPASLEKFTTEHGKIIPGRLSGLGSKAQRKIKKAVKQARAKGVI